MEENKSRMSIAIGKACDELLKDGYSVEIRGSLRDHYIHNYHDIFSVFNIIAVKKNDVRFIHISSQGKLNYAKSVITKNFYMDYPSIEIWIPQKGVGWNIYKIIDGEWYNLKMVGKTKINDIHNSKIKKYILYNRKGIMILGSYNAYFIPNDDWYDNFEKFINDIGYEENSRIYITTDNGNITVRVYGKD